MTVRDLRALLQHGNCLVNRNKFLIALGSEEKERSLDAALELLRLELGSEGVADPILPVTLRKDTRSKDCLEVIFGTSEADTHKSAISVSEIRACAEWPRACAKRALSMAIEGCKADSAEDPISSGAPTRCLDDLEVVASCAVRSEIVTHLRRRIEEGESVCLLGKSASGKTVAAAQLVTDVVRSGWSFTWIDLSHPGATALDIGLDACSSSKGPSGKHLVIIDDAQTNPGEAAEASWVVKYLERASKVDNSTARYKLGIRLRRHTQRLRRCCDVTMLR